MKALEIAINELNKQVFELLSTGAGCEQSINRATEISQAIMHQAEMLETTTRTVHQLTCEQSDKCIKLTMELENQKRIEQ